MASTATPRRFAPAAFLGLLTWALLGATPATAQTEVDLGQLEGDDRCAACHGQAHIAELELDERLPLVAPLEPGQAPSPPEARPGLLVRRTGDLQHSVHAEISCTTCHPDAETLPHAMRLEPARCEDCHEEQAVAFGTSIHGRATADGEPAASCADCHGTHDTRSHQDELARSFVLNQQVVCAECHATEDPDSDLATAAADYLDSVHGRGLTIIGLAASPSCTDCHGVHAILPAEEPGSPVHPGRVSGTCGSCHPGVEATLQASIHGTAAGDDGPSCVDCHTAHTIGDPHVERFKLESDERCGACHEDSLEHYRETFHGKAIALEDPNEAACYDCHGDHDIQPKDHPDSHLSAANKLETCRKCHPDAGGDFAGYLAHGDHADRDGYPALYWTFLGMTALLLGTFGFFGVHTALWTTRSMVMMVRNPRVFREAKVAAQEDDEVFVRFRPFERFLHIIVIISFLLLVATGMPLKYYDADWARPMIEVMGGIDATSQLHRLGAILTFLYFGLHLASLARAFWRRRGELRDPESGRPSLRRAFRLVTGPDMPVPHLNDLKDLWAHQKWFFGRGPRPQFDRWTYWEKFDYLAVFWGVGVIGLSGLLLWFPEVATRFLPGWSINIATIIHSDEALLAAGFIFTFHFFNTHLRLERFPIDSVIFSGRISRTEMLHERRRWHDRLEAEGRLDELRVGDEWQQWRKVVHPLGFLAFGLGLCLLALILYATITSLVAAA